MSDLTRVNPRDIVPNWDAAVRRCVRDHRLPSDQIPCVECQQAVHRMKETTMKVRFYEDNQGEHRWTLDGDNGEPLSMASEGYKRQDDAVHCFELTTGTHVAMATGEAIRLITPSVIDGEPVERIKVEVED